MPQMTVPVPHLPGVGYDDMTESELCAWLAYYKDRLNIVGCTTMSLDLASQAHERIEGEIAIIRKHLENLRCAA